MTLIGSMAQMGSVAVLCVNMIGCTLSFVYPPLTDGGNSGDSLCTGRPGVTSTTVNTVSELRAALQAITSDSEIRLAAGTYLLTSDLPQLGSSLSNVTIRGDTGDRADVILDGQGTAMYGLVAAGAQQVYIADLTIREVTDNALLFAGDADQPHVCNVHLINAQAGFITSGSAAALDPAPDDGIVEHSLIEYIGAATSANTNGVAIINGARWIIRDNRFRNLLAPPASGLMGPAILAFYGSRDTRAERNVVINCDRGIAFGLVERTPTDDHSGGIIRNNVVYRAAGVGNAPDVGIHVADSPNTKVLHNTVLLNGSYPRPIEYRFTDTTNGLIQHNLVDGPIESRDFATGTVTGNLSNAQSSWFVDVSQLDFHLTASATPAIDAATTSLDVPDDIDGDSRTADAAPDIGADEHVP